MSSLKNKATIKAITRIDYQSFWKKNNGAVFLDANWLEIVTNESERVEYYGSFESGILVNVFSVVVKAGKFLQTITLPKLTPFSGWVLPGDNAALKSFISKLKNAAIYYPLMDDSSMNTPLITHQLDLELTEEILFLNLRQDKKRNIKKAKTQNLKLEIKSDYQLIESLIKLTFERQKHPFDGYQQVKKIIETYTNHFQVNVWKDDTCLASLLMVHDDRTAYYLIGGFNNTKNDYNAGPFGMWNAILHAQHLNLRVFDFEGSMIPSIAKYFKSFGASEINYSAIQNEKWYLAFIKRISR